MMLADSPLPCMRCASPTFPLSPGDRWPVRVPAAHHAPQPAFAAQLQFQFGQARQYASPHSDCGIGGVDTLAQ